MYIYICINQTKTRGEGENKKMEHLYWWFCSRRKGLKKMSPYLWMIFTQISAAVYAILSKVIFTDLGTNPLVFNFYQFMVATIFMAPLAFFFERKSRPPLNLSITCRIFLLALLGATLFQNLFSASLFYISSTSLSAIYNLFPAFTYILSVISRQEEAELNRLRGLGKLFGTLLSVLGAFTLIFWRTDIVQSIVDTSMSMPIGYILATLGVFSLSSWLVLQSPVTTKYPAELSMTTMLYFFGAMQTFIIASVFSTTSHNKASSGSQWMLKWDLELLNIVFGGVVNGGIVNFIYIWYARKKGPSFVAVFAPLNLILVALMEMAFLGNTMDLGSVMGSVMIVGGLYLFLWSKSKEGVDGSNDNDDSSGDQSIITIPLLTEPESMTSSYRSRIVSMQSLISIFLGPLRCTDTEKTIV